MSSPYAALLSAAGGPILVVLAGTTKPLSGREIARIAGISSNGAWKALRRLADHGVINEQPAGGNVTLYTLNRDHVAADAIVTLTRLRSILIDKIRMEVGSWEIQPPHASMFGSAARGDGDTGSDVDIFIVRPKGVVEEDSGWRSQVNALADAILSWTGNHASVSEVPENDLARLRRERPMIIQNLTREGIHLVGEPTTRIFGQGR